MSSLSSISSGSISPISPGRALAPSKCPSRTRVTAYPPVRTRARDSPSFLLPLHTRTPALCSQPLHTHTPALLLQSLAWLLPGTLRSVEPVVLSEQLISLSTAGTLTLPVLRHGTTAWEGPTYYHCSSSSGPAAIQPERKMQG